MFSALSSAIRKPHSNIILELRSFSTNEWYSVSLKERSCTCAGFTANRQPCKHLNALGIYSVARPFVPKTHPTFSQALSGMVKSIRLRELDDAIYWLTYLDTFSDSQHRFRTARRILIGSAEDGHSIAVMERAVESFTRITTLQTSLENLAIGVVRVCRVPNWWHPSSGGHDYIYQGMLGERLLWQLETERTSENFMDMLERAIVEQDKAKALAATLGFTECRLGGTKQAEFLLTCAKKAGHKEAQRLAIVHLNAKSALSSDNNFICQSAWLLAGGTSPVADVIETVHFDEVVELLEKANDRWKEPKPIPGWCCDGVHSSGNDMRFMGAWPHMNAVCRAFLHYGRVDPDDIWLPEFQSYDGLTVRIDCEENCNQLQKPERENYNPLHEMDETNNATN